MVVLMAAAEVEAVRVEGVGFQVLRAGAVAVCNPTGTWSFPPSPRKTSLPLPKGSSQVPLEVAAEPARVAEAMVAMVPAVRSVLAGPMDYLPQVLVI